MATLNQELKEASGENQAWRVQIWLMFKKMTRQLHGAWTTEGWDKERKIAGKLFSNPGKDDGGSNQEENRQGMRSIKIQILFWRTRLSFASRLYVREGKGKKKNQAKLQEFWLKQLGRWWYNILWMVLISETENKSSVLSLLFKMPNWWGYQVVNWL